MTTEKEKRIISHDIELGTKENPQWRNWGYSVELNPFDYRMTSSCEFCKTDSGVFFKTVCFSGSNSNISIGSSYNPETGDFTFYCCENCVEKLTKLIQEQDPQLLNHQRLINVIELLKTK